MDNSELFEIALEIQQRLVYLLVKRGLTIYRIEILDLGEDSGIILRVEYTGMNEEEILEIEIEEIKGRPNFHLSIDPGSYIFKTKNRDKLYKYIKDHLGD